MSKLSFKYLLFTFLTLSLFFLSIDFKSDNSNTISDYNVYSLSIPEKMEFCGEFLPLSKSGIKERIDRVVGKYILAIQWFFIIKKI